MNITTFWDAHYRIEDDELRVMIADVVTSTLLAAGWSRKKLAAQTYRHPMTRRKNYLSRFSILEILADFIIKADMVTERTASHPVKNADAEFYREQQRKKREISLEAFIEGGGQVDLTGQIYLPREDVTNL
ncbi:hypothetical protein [Paenibacillus brasilensis]|uniref:Phage protein n=1 Tax=Paenibacillus brasilensis TaxID=128574 RepID=A0ABU0KS62_9BACL|nr:hypothetical protein [Paenibacillus brasilensis]MDQ0492276.1 hypothetical protein [Paenibacillus brasilensis]